MALSKVRDVTALQDKYVSFPLSLFPLFPGSTNASLVLEYSVFSSRFANYSCRSWRRSSIYSNPTSWGSTTLIQSSKAFLLTSFRFCPSSTPFLAASDSLAAATFYHGIFLSLDSLSRGTCTPLSGSLSSSQLLFRPGVVLGNESTSILYSPLTANSFYPATRSLEEDFPHPFCLRPNLPPSRFCHELRPLSRNTPPPPPWNKKDYR